MSAETASAIPPALVASITAGALAASTANAGAGLTLLKIMTFSKIKLAVLGALAVVGVAAIHRVSAVPNRGRSWKAREAYTPLPKIPTRGTRSSHG